MAKTKVQFLVVSPIIFGCEDKQQSRRPVKAEIAGAAPVAAAKFSLRGHRPIVGRRFDMAKTKVQFLVIPPLSDVSNNSMFTCLSSRTERGQHPSHPPISVYPHVAKQQTRRFERPVSEMACRCKSCRGDQFGLEATADRHPSLKRVW